MTPTPAGSELRAKYDADQLKELGEKGHAFKNADGSYSYPIADVEDLDNAIRAVGRGGADHDTIRKYIIGRAADLDASDKIPDNWNADGSLKQANSRLAVGKKRRHRAGPPLGREFRHFAARDLEVRDASDGSDTIEITGTPIVYNTPYTVRDIFGEFEETMLPGVASDVLAAGPDVRFLINHDGMPLARTLSGTLTLDGSNSRGVQMSARLDARSSQATDLAVAIERGDISQMSCGFCVAQDDWSDDGTQRSIAKLGELFDVSAVTYPASPTTDIELAYRSLLAQPIASQARTRQLWVQVGRDLRAGKVLSAENAGHLQAALAALHAADDVDITSIVKSLQTIDQALDLGQAGLSTVLGKADPDGDPADLEPALTPADSETTSDTDDDGTGDGAAGLVDGTGSRHATPPADRAARRAATDSFNDIQQALATALQAKYPAGEDGWCDLWLQDAGPDWVVWRAYDQAPEPGLWRCSYSIDDQMTVTFTSDPVQVAVETSYVPVQRSTAAVALELEAEQLRLRARRHRRAA